MARATRYLYNKPADNVRVRGTTPPKTLRGVKSIETSEGERVREREKEQEREGEGKRRGLRERETARELFSFYAIEGRSLIVTWHIGGCENLIALDRTT